ncbi:MAG: lysozyme [Arenicella sp.]|jgi:lysozyme
MKTGNLVIIAFSFLGLLFLLFRPSIDLLPEASASKKAPISAEQEVTTATTVLPSKGAENLKGIDVSFYQGDIPWSSIDHDGIAFAYVKATEGVTLVDPQYKNNVAKLKSTTIRHGSYHFFEPDDDAEKQVDFFLSNVNVGGQLPPVLDIEVSHGVSPASIKSSALIWLKAVESKTGCKPIIYTYKDFWETNLGSEFNDYPLWLADYADHPSLPNGVSSYIFWQHSQKGTVKGISGSVDLDVYPGTEDDLQSLLCKS